MDIQLPFDSPKYLSRRSPSSGLSMSVSPRSPSWKEWFRKVRGLQRHEDQCTERKVFNRNESRKRCTVAGVKDCALRRVVMMCHGGWAETYLACCRLRESPVRPALQTLTPPNLIIPPMNDLDLIPLADTISQFPVTRATAAFLSDEGLRILLCSLSGKIKKIRLGGLKITEKGWRILAAFISMNEQLQSLEIRETLIVEGVVACLVEAINKSSLDRLSLRKCGPMTARVFQETNVPFIGIGGDQGILEILPHKTKIRGISISEIPMNNLDWLLPLCPMLVELELRKCSITSDLLNPILDKLENIERVGLAANDIFPGVRIDKLCNCEILDISETPIASLDGLVGEKMQVLRLYNTSISNDQILEAVQSSKLIRVEKNNLDPSVAEICLKHMEEQLELVGQGDLTQRVADVYDVLQTQENELLSTSLAYHFPKATSPESTNSQSLQKGRAISPTAQDVEEGNFHRLATYLKENFNITADCAQEEGRLYSGEEVRQRVRSVGGERIAEAKTKEQLKELLGMQE